MHQQGLNTTWIPKGVYRFKTLEEADQHRQECVARGTLCCRTRSVIQMKAAMSVLNESHRREQAA